MKIPWKEKGKPTIVAVYKKQKTSNKHYMIVTDIHVDILINGRATKPIIDHKYDIVEMGIGEGFIETWSKKYGIRKPQVIEKYPAK
jgi:hypothetical protein|tara:strand:- start:242 stop:499 length:258 start_codon:yes stop_codon:yes gene_type:complete